MYLYVSEFIASYKKYDDYQKTIARCKNRIDELKKQECEELEQLAEQQYNHIKTSISYETAVDAEGKEVKIMKPRSSSSLSQTEIIEMYDNKRDILKREYASKIKTYNSIIEECENKIKEIDTILSRLSKDANRICKIIYLEGKSYREVARAELVSPSKLYRDITSEIQRAIEEI